MPPRVPDHELIHRIGGGSYGEVWLAKNAVGTLRAVKVVRRASFKSERPYEREFSGMLKFEPVSRSHEGLMDILQVGRNDAEGYFYYVMELADDAKVSVDEPLPESDPHETLRRIPSASDIGSEAMEPRYRPLTLSAAKAIQGQLPLADCLRYFSTLTSALQVLHLEGLIHRDIKPSNIIIVGGVAKLADIGLVTDVDDTRSFVGTEGFIPPEGPGTPQADVYSLGKVLYEVATGKDRKEYPSLPLGNDSKNPPRDLLELNAIISRACAAHLTERYANAAEIHADLALLQSGRSVRSLHAFDSRLRAAKRLGAVAVAVAAVAVAALGLASWTARIERESRERTEAALKKVEAAERDARKSLYDSLVVSAVAERRSDLMGRGFAALDVIVAASKIRPHAFELRNAAISALALPDARLLRRSELPSWASAQGFSLDLETLFVCATNGVVHAFRAADGQELYTFGDPGVPASSVVPVGFTGRWLHISYGDGRYDLWDLLSRRLFAGKQSSASFRFSPDERWLVTTLFDSRVTVWDLPRNDFREMKIEGGPFAYVDFVGSNRVALASRQDSKLRVLNIETGAVGDLLKTYNDEAPSLLDSTLEGGTLAVGFSSGFLALYELQHPSRPRVVVAPHIGNLSRLALHPDGDWGLTASWDSTTKLVGVSEGQVISQLRSGNSLHVFARDGRHVVAYSPNDKALRVFQCRGREVCRVLGETIPTERSLVGPWNGGFSSDGHMLVVASYDGLRIYETGRGRELAHLSARGWFAAEFVGESNIFSAGLNGLARWPLARDENETIRVSNRTYVDPNGHWHLRAATNGVVVTSTTDGGFLVLRADGSKSHVVQGNIARGVTLSSDARLILGWSDSPSRAVVLESASGSTLREIPVQANGFAAFSPASDRVVVNDLDAVVVHDIGSRRELWRKPSSGTGAAIAWSPDGRTIAAIREGFIVMLLDASSGELLAQLEHPDALPYNNIAFDREGAQLACFSTGHRTHLWNFRALRRELAAIDLDWDLPPLPPAKVFVSPRVEVLSPSAL